MTDRPENDPRAVDHERLLREAVKSASSQGSAGAPSAPPAWSPDELTARLPGFEVLELIARGGMGAVYKAIQRKLDRVVALKVLPEELAAEPGFEARFLREARALASLTHPHVLTVYDFGEADGLYYLATEYVDGVNLRQLMEMGELSAAEALRITPQICQALQYAHEKGVVHRDVKPENILVDTEGQIRIADFGLAKLLGNEPGPELTRSTQVLGTPHYMAPEQWRSSAGVDHRADIFSLGVVLYEMLTGQLPLGHYDPPSSRTGVPRSLDEIVRRTLAQQPDHRYQSARELQSDVEGEAEALRRHQPRARPARAANGEARLCKLPLLALALLILGAVAVCVSVFVVEQQQRDYRRSRIAQAAYRDAMSAREKAGQMGQPVEGPEPTPPAVVAPPVGALPTLIVSSGGLMTLIVMLLGFASVRRIRRSRGQLRGMGLAVLIAWAVPLGIADGLGLAPIVNIRDHDTQQILLFFVGALLAAGNIIFLVWMTRRQNRLALEDRTM